MRCEMCGKQTELISAEIEGSIMTVCEECGKFGKVIGKKISATQKTTNNSQIKQKLPNVNFNHISTKEVEETEDIVSNFSKLIKDARERKGLKQEELALKINEKESIIHKIETGIKPSMDLAKKLERFLNIKLIEKVEETSDNVIQRSDESLTLGDMIKIKKKK